MFGPVTYLRNYCNLYLVNLQSLYLFVEILQKINYKVGKFCLSCDCPLPQLIMFLNWLPLFMSVYM